MKEAPKARPDKEKILDEVWDDDRVKSFLHTSTPTQSGQTFPGDPDFFVLLRAYRAMRAHDFERFLVFFREQGGDIEARNGDGQTMYDYLATHKKATPYRQALSDARVASTA